MSVGSERPSRVGASGETDADWIDTSSSGHSNGIQEAYIVESSEKTMKGSEDKFRGVSEGTFLLAAIRGREERRKGKTGGEYQRRFH